MTTRVIPLGLGSNILPRREAALRLCVSKHLIADDILPLVACLTQGERLRLLRLIVVRPEMDDASVYRALPPAREEFSSDSDPLAWDAEGWESVG